MRCQKKLPHLQVTLKYTELLRWAIIRTHNKKKIESEKEIHRVRRRKSQVKIINVKNLISEILGEHEISFFMLVTYFSLVTYLQKN